MTDYRIQISFELSEFSFDPLEITAGLGLEPYSFGRRGEDDPVRDLPRMNFWALRSRPSDASASLDARWEDLISRLEGRFEVLAGYAKGAKSTFFVIVGQDNRRPVLKFTARQIQFVASCGAGLEID